MVLVAGIDPSTKRIAVVARVDEPRVVKVHAYELVKKSATQDVASLGRALDAMQDFVEWANTVAPNGDRVAWVESPLVATSGGVSATLKQALVGGIIRAVLHNGGFDVRDVYPGTWKKTVTGNGNSKKPAVKQAVRSLDPKTGAVIGDDIDLIDAAAIQIHGQRILEQERVVRGPAEPAQRRVQGRRPRVVVRQSRLR